MPVRPRKAVIDVGGAQLEVTRYSRQNRDTADAIEVGPEVRARLY